MTPDAKKKLIGAFIAAALAIAVYYGVIDQKQADSIRTQSDQTLGTGPATQQPPQNAPQPAPQPGATTTQNPQTSAPAAPAPQTNAPPPQ